MVILLYLWSKQEMGFSCTEYHTVEEVTDLINFAPVSWLVCQQSVDFLKLISHAEVLAAYFLLVIFSLEFDWEQFVFSTCFCNSNCFDFTQSGGPFSFPHLRNKFSRVAVHQQSFQKHFPQIFFQISLKIFRLGKSFCQRHLHTEKTLTGRTSRGAKRSSSNQLKMPNTCVQDNTFPSPFGSFLTWGDQRWHPWCLSPPWPI